MSRASTQRLTSVLSAVYLALATGAYAAPFVLIATVLAGVQ